MSLAELTAFMPHRAPMLFLDELREHSATHAVCTRAVRSGDLFVGEDGEMSPLVVLELFAQAAAAHFGYEGLVRGGGGVGGALLGTNRIDVTGALRVGDVLEIHVQQVMVMAPLAQYGCELFRDGEKVAWGTIKVAMTGQEQG